MVLGTAAADETGELYLSAAAKSRCDRAAEAFFDHRFKREKESLLLSGGYSKEFSENPPIGREALLMADYLIRQYALDSRALLVEDESTTTEENFRYSLLRYPGFFEDVVNDGDRKLALVSRADHLERAVSIGSRVLQCAERNLVKRPTWEVIQSNDNIVPLRRSVALPTESYAAADDM